MPPGRGGADPPSKRESRPAGTAAALENQVDTCRIIAFPRRAQARRTKPDLCRDIDLALQLGALEPWERNFLTSARRCLPQQLALLLQILQRASP